MSRLPAVVFVLLFALWGCSPGPRQSAGSPRQGGLFKLIYQNPPETLDPQRIVYVPDWELASLAYEGLVGHGERLGEIRPALAESWEQHEGGRRWVFTLRTGAYFHDDPCFRGGRGREATAADAAYTLERIADPKTACENWYLFSNKIDGIDEFHAGRAPSIRGVRVLDPRRIEIRLTRPYASFLKILATQTALIVPREAVAYYGAEFASHPVGTGPFRLARLKPLEQLLFARHPRYWRKDAAGRALPYLDSIDVRIRADASESVNLAAFLRGETYLFTAQQKLYDTLRSDAAYASRFTVAGAVPPAALRFLGFSLDTATPLARNAELRRAVAMAFDRAGLARQSPQIPLQLADTLVPRFFLDRPGKPLGYDPEAAKAIFARYSKELAAAPPTLGVNFQSGEIDLLRRNLAGLAVRSTVQIRPVQYYEYIVKERPSLFRVSFTPSFFDPEDYYCLFYSKSSSEVNLTGYRSEEYDRTLESAMAEMNAGRRMALFVQLEQILQRDMPAIYLTHGTPAYLLAAPKVRGLAVRFLHPNFAEAWLAPDEPNAAAQSSR